jgi:hypothetical protein
MKTTWLTYAWLALALGVWRGQSAEPQSFSGDYSKLRADAEKLYAEGSYARARELYLAADELALAPPEARWVDFRLADTLWRSQAATRTSDASLLDEARRGLEELLRGRERAEDRDRVWAEAEESLADFWWTRRDSRNWGQALGHYQQALDWWAGARDIDQGRERYLAMVFRMAAPPGVDRGYYYGYYGNAVPLPLLENALKIAERQEDRARAHYLVALALSQTGDPSHGLRVPEEFEAALASGKPSEWYDDALYQYAEWMAGRGPVTFQEDGQLRQEPDFVKALALYRRLLAEFPKGDSAYHDRARQQIENITRPLLDVTVSHVFLPDSEIEFHLSWRNVGRIDLALYRLDLTRDLNPARLPDRDFVDGIDLGSLPRQRAWTKETGDRGDYRPGQETLRLYQKDERLPRGAYLLEASGAGQSARELVLVTDAALVLKASGDKALAYFCSALDGSPLPGARIRLWQRSRHRDRAVWESSDLLTNSEGLAVFNLPSRKEYVELLATAAVDDRQAFSAGNSSGPYGVERHWRIYAFTDRPAYRPGEEVRFKVIARRAEGSAYRTPAGQVLEFQINDPRGSKVKEGRLSLNAFGSAWGTLELTESLPLGEYRMSFWNEGRRDAIGQATLFRLEEYKLPEFKVSVATPEEAGKKKAFRLGETVEVTIQAEYYFGGPVANAAVEALVYQSPFSFRWLPPREYPWFYEDGRHWRHFGGVGQVIRRETLKTDALGKARLSFETPHGSAQELEYRIEARVTDSSRREIVASDTVRVTRQRYYVHLQPEHNLHRPGDLVRVAVKTLDANQNPLSAEGTVKITRDRWLEVWIDPSGRELQGDELRRFRERGEAPRPPWRIKFRGYQQDEILTRRVKTSGEGEGEIAFTPERDGYYRVAWASPDPPGVPVRGETTVWVATNATTEVGYRSGAVEILVDKDTFRVGEKAPVMLHAPTSGRWVLFSVEAEDLLSYQLVRLEGTTKLLELAIDPRHVPNVFLSATLVSDAQIFLDTKAVVVPPVEHFLSVELSPAQEDYQPRAEASFTLTARDHLGKPVAAEIALSVADESVYYIQSEYASDPRQFYFGDRRGQRVQTSSTFQYKGYRRHPVQTDEEREGLPSGGELGFGGGGRLQEGIVADAYESTERAALSQVAKARAEVPAAAAPPSPAEAPGKEPAVVVRSDFRATAFWQPDVLTDANGQARVKLKLPDSLTTWKATARLATRDQQFGIASGATRTRQPLMVRLQAPRFFVVGDQVTVSAVLNNTTRKAMQVRPALQADGLESLSTGPASRTGEAVRIEAGGEARVDFLVRVDRPGEARLKVSAREETGDRHVDAMEKSFLVHEHGIEKLVAAAGKMRGDDLSFQIELPRERRPGSTTLTVSVAPSLAVTLLDALPYLVDYPYGCTEQTMSRFLPAVIVTRTLRDLGLPPEAAMDRVFGGIESQHLPRTQPQGKKDLRRLDELVGKGLARLYDFQHGDGGWGWWKEGESDHFMTAYVVWGLTLARQAGVEVRTEAVSRAVRYLDLEIVEEETNHDLQAFMLHALAAHQAASAEKSTPYRARAWENLWKNRDGLNAYTRALLALAAHSLGERERAKILVQNLENGVKRDEKPQSSRVQRGAPAAPEGGLATAHWGEDGLYWRWSDGGVEATSFALRALLAIDPGNALVEPVTHWLVKNRRGAQWSNTRDTAISVLALNDYLKVSGELAQPLAYEIEVNGHPIASRSLSAEEALGAPSRFAVDSRYLRDGANTIHLVRKDGRGPIYFSAEARFVSREEPIPAAGNEIFVRRQYTRLLSRPTLLKGHVEEEEPLGDGGMLLSGERAKVRLVIEAKNNYEYLVFEDLKPAGLEAVAIRSGASLFARELRADAVDRRMAQEGNLENADFTGRTRWVYQELRDRKVALFIDKLPQGIWEIEYELRAETPGSFHALPLLGHAMYVPEIRANGEEVRIQVQDRP